MRRSTSPLIIRCPQGTPLHWSITQQHSSRPVAIWIYDQPEAPRFSTAMTRSRLTPQLVFARDGKEIYRLPDPASYWQAASCQLRDQTRTTLRLRCPAANLLLRRELFFPGWRARVNGILTPIRKDGLFQVIALPPGSDVVTFTYAPPGIMVAEAAAVVGVLLTVWLGWPARIPTRVSSNNQDQKRAESVTTPNWNRPPGWL